MTPSDYVLHMIAARLAESKPVTPDQLRNVVTKAFADHFPDVDAHGVIAELAVQLVAERTSRDVPGEWAWLEITQIHARLTDLLARREERRQRALQQTVDARQGTGDE